MAHSSSLTSGILEKHPSARICTLSMVQTNKADGKPIKKAITRDMTLQPPESEKSDIKSATTKSATTKSAIKNSTKSTTKEWNEHLVTLGAHQDRKAFKALFDHFSPLLKNYFIGKYPTQSSYQMIEELIQEVMIKVWQKASSYDPSKAAASTWIFTLARNTRIDMLRRQNKYANTTSIETEEIWEDTTENGPYTFLTQKRDESLIKQKLLALPDEQQIVIRKVYMEAKSHTEVATELQLPLGTVKSRVRLAQKKLQAMLQDTKQHEM